MSATAPTRPAATRPARRRRRPSGLRVAGRVGAALGLLVLAVITVGPAVVGHDPNAIDITSRFAAPSAQHWLGTDDLGRDLASRLAHGGRGTLLIALGAVALASVIAIPLGIVTGYVGGAVDLVVTRVVDLFFAIPTLLVAIGIVGIFGASLTTTVLALGLSYWAFYTRLVRAAVVGIRSRPYVDAAQVLGASRWRIIRTEILPGLLPLVLVQTTAMLGFAILDEAALGFLGLGVQPPEPSWGSLLAQSRQFILSNPELGLIAGIPVLIAVFAINLMSDALRGVLDPKGRDT
jgi:ABC-type dipeptide/oligopeptide/nickel transport system permease subunit